MGRLIKILSIILTVWPISLLAHWANAERCQKVKIKDAFVQKIIAGAPGNKDVWIFHILVKNSSRQTYMVEKVSFPENETFKIIDFDLFDEEVALTQTAILPRSLTFIVLKIDDNSWIQPNQSSWKNSGIKVSLTTNRKGKKDLIVKDVSIRPTKYRR